ncbi:hypothetical protein GWI33_001743 [Rhynchophorus ferrugineus]|uniref:Uncharacterized protein n=1 Tax=Rhynchophorus ferrugineus TaxID=354439 RepID=A0A834IUM7_RHYFE|nr:hypothetical protein GWI33_001743 [Rhynchophorus ferrugineus]
MEINNYDRNRPENTIVPMIKTDWTVTQNQTPRTTFVIHQRTRVRFVAFSRSINPTAVELAHLFDANQWEIREIMRLQLMNKIQCVTLAE